MKKVRFLILTLCIICLVTFIWADYNKEDLKKEYVDLKCPARMKSKILSVLNKVHEYQNMFLMYREMHLAVPKENTSLRIRTSNKLEGFLYKLDIGNDFKVNGQKVYKVEGQEIIRNKLKYPFVPELLDPEVTDVWFEITNISFKHEFPKVETEYAIDCHAFVKMKCHIEKNHNDTYDMELTIDHMKNCWPD